MMKKQRIAGILVILALASVALVATTPPQEARATVSWPIDEGNTPVTRVYSHGNDNLTLEGCRDSNTLTNLKAGVVHDSLNSSSVVNLDCVAATEGSETDGTYYGQYLTSTAPYFEIAAYNNGRIKWVTSNLQFPISNPNVAACSSPINRMDQLLNLSIGADGNPYMILEDSNYNCGVWFVGLNSSTGAVLSGFPISLGLGTDGLFTPRVWTYNDKIIAVGPGGMEHVYAYNGVENMAAQYQFPKSTSFTYATPYANADGRVYMVENASGGCSNEKIYSHDLTGLTPNHNIVRVDCWGSPPANFTVGGNGDLYAYQAATNIYDYDLVDGTVSSPNLGMPTGYGWSGLTIVDLWADASGNVLVVRDIPLATGSHPVSVFVDYIDAATGTATNLFEADGTDATMQAGVGDVDGGYLYLPIQYFRNTSVSPFVSDFKIQKINVGSFAPLRT